MTLTMPFTSSAAHRRAFLGILALLVFLLVVAAVWIKIHSAHSAYLSRFVGAQWILPGAVKHVGQMPNLPTQCVFEQTIQLTDATPQPLQLELRALGAWQGAIGGIDLDLPLHHATLPSVPFRTTLGQYSPLPSGPVRIAIQLKRSMGPTALWLRLTDAKGNQLAATDGDWLYSINGSSVVRAHCAQTPASVWIADATDPFEIQSSLIWGLPWATAALALIGLGALAWGLRAASGDQPVRPPTLRQYWFTVFAAMTVWSILLAVAACYISYDNGFDIDGHLEYIQHIRTTSAIPLAHQGWQMYQAPGYYLLTGFTLRLLGLHTQSDGGIITLRIINWLIAMGFLAASAGAFQRFFQRRLDRAALAFLLLASCPVSFYLFCYFTNENLHTFAVSLVFLAFAGLRGKRAESWLHTFLLGLSLGFALLSKVSGIMLFIPVAVVYGLRGLSFIRQRRYVSASRTVLHLCVVVIASFLFCGWYYAKVWSSFGTPVMGNWNPESGQVWWQVPGYRVWEDYMPDLHAFTHPLLSSFNSVWSGIFSTWAGDSLLGGATRIDYRPTWNYWVFPVSLAASLAFFGLAAWGCVRCVSFVRGRFTKRDLAFTALIIGSGAAILLMTLEVPSYSLTKSFYALMLVLPLCCFASAVLASGRRAPFSLPCVLALAAPWILVLPAMFLVVPTAANRSVWAARDQANDAAPAVALIHIQRRAVADDPQNWPARIALARLLLFSAQAQEHEPEIARLLDLDSLEKTVSQGGKLTGGEWAERLALLAQSMADPAQPGPAIELFTLSLRASPAREQRWIALASLLQKSGKIDQSRTTARHGLVYFPWSVRLAALAAGKP